MTAQDRVGFAELMAGLGETYGEPVSDARMEIYYRALSDMALDEVRAAANVHVRTNKFFPRPSELREAMDGTLDDAAEMAWQVLLREIRRVGWCGTPRLSDDALLRAAMELFGGWEALCQKLPGEGPEFLGWAKQFKALYKSHAKRDVTALLPGHEPLNRLEAQTIAKRLRAQFQVTRGES
jgi:hypothetical protein